MLVACVDPICEIYEDTKTKVAIIAELYNNTSNMHMFITIQVILKLHTAKKKSRKRQEIVRITEKR